MSEMLEVTTGLFGQVTVRRNTIFHFPRGLLGLHDHQRWCLLRLDGLDRVEWLQSVDEPALALMLVNPDELFDDYDLWVDPAQIGDLEVSDRHVHEATPPVVMRVVVRPEADHGAYVVNAGAPILFNIESRRGLQFEVPSGSLPERYSRPVRLRPQTEASARRRP